MPHRASKKPRAPERDYSHRSLLDKLGVRPDQAIAVLGIEDPSFLRELTERVAAFAQGSLSAKSDLIFLSVENVKDLARLKRLIPAIHKSGAIWIVYPKGQSHIREADVMAAGKSAGLTDNKVCRFSETHTALRFVIPLARR
jgi:hypothetical protein